MEMLGTGSLLFRIIKCLITASARNAHTIAIASLASGMSPCTSASNFNVAQSSGGIGQANPVRSS
jgi:hypothetical protein